MLIFHGPKLVVFSIPRTGSTSLHKALRPFADIEFSNPPAKKHMNVRRFEKWATDKRPNLLHYTRIAVMREPLSRMASWYAYRQRDAVRGQPASTEGMSFEAFIALALSDEPPPAALIGNQYRFLTRADGSLGVDELFCIERSEVLLSHLAKHFGDIFLPHRNASPEADLDLSLEGEVKLREARRDEFELFARVAPTGHFTPPVP